MDIWKFFNCFLASSTVLLVTSGTVYVFGSGHLYFLSFPPSLFGISKALIQSFKTALDIGPTVVPPYWTVPFGLSMAI